MSMTSAESDMHLADASPMSFLWDLVKKDLPKSFSQSIYKSWLEPLVFHDFISGRFILAAPSRFMRDWITTNCAQTLLELIRQENPTILALDIVVDPNLTKVSAPTSSSPQETPDTSAGKQEDLTIESDEPLNADEIGFDQLGSRLDPKYKFESFVVGQSNELAHAAALRVAESDRVHFNPLFLYGGVGLGKTHLMHAIAWHIRQNHPKRKVVYLSAEKFMYHFIRALRFKDTVAFKDRFRSVDVLMIDDFQFISGKESTQEEFFHTFNALVDQNHQIIMSADKSPSDLQGLEERLKSRLGWGLVADIHPTTYELRLGILQSKVDQLNVTIPAKVLEFLAHKITSNVRELEGALNRIVAHSTLVGRAIALDMVQEVLRDVLRANDRRVSIDDIQKKVAEHFNIKLADINSSKRNRNISRPRQIAMYLSKIMTSSSLPEIGRKFGGRDHTTVLHAVKKVGDLSLEDLSFQEDIDLLKRMLQS